MTFMTDGQNQAATRPASAFGEEGKNMFWF